MSGLAANRTRDLGDADVISPARIRAQGARGGMTMRQHAMAAFLVLGIALAAAPRAHSADVLRTVGWLEKVKIENTRLAIVAKVDTGADYSSLDARHIRSLERDGEPWVSFTITDDKGDSLEIERHVFRFTTIRRAGAVEQKRPTVILGLCVGTVYREVQVNLVDRSALEYRMLIGRDFLQGHYVVDPARTYVTTPGCP